MDDKQTKQRITITIANRSYSFEIEREKLDRQEPLARSAAEEIKKRYDKYQKVMERSEKSDIQDVLALAAWDIAYDYLALKDNADTEILSEKIERINKKIENYLRVSDDTEWNN